jgi:hypothetical protein
MKKYILLFAAISALFFSCKKDKSATVVFTGYSYAPENIGHEIIYEVDSIVKSDFDGLTHTNHFQIRELIADTFTDNQGRPTLRLERYKRLTANDPWVIYKVWTANKTNVHYEKKEDNVSYVKLVFPPASSITWNGNSLNTLEQRDYKYASFNVPETFNNLSFDSALTVLQYDYGDFLDTVHNEEKYATQVGMFYKIEDSTYYHTDFNNPAYDSIVFRRLYTEKIISFSN